MQHVKRHVAHLCGQIPFLYAKCSRNRKGSLARVCDTSPRSWTNQPEVQVTTQRARCSLFHGRSYALHSDAVTNERPSSCAQGSKTGTFFCVCLQQDVSTAHKTTRVPTEKEPREQLWVSKPGSAAPRFADQSSEGVHDIGGSPV